MVPQITEINFPVDQSGKQLFTLHQATINIADMGDRTITTQVRIDGSLAPSFIGSDGQDLAISFKGEKYIHPLREPQAQKGVESMNSLVDLTFQHWAIYQLKRYYFVELSSIGSGTAIPDKYEASLSLNLQNFCTALSNVLSYYFHGKIVVDLNPSPLSPYDPEPVFMNIDYSYIWDVIQNINDVYNRRWSLAYNSTTDVYSIRIGYETSELSHIFEYGYEGGLLKVERQVQSDGIRNIILGRGGTKNLPKLYFKDYSKYHPSQGDWDNGNFAPDPDAIPELMTIYFDGLRDANFRKYVQGWAAQQGYSGHTYQPGQGWAYEKGYTDETFQPVEYVKDDASIAKYGELWGALSANEDIYPSIQNYENDLGRIDEIVDAEQVTTDDVEALARESSIISNIEGKQITNTVNARSRITSDLTSEQFTVGTGLTGRLSYTWFCKPSVENPAITIDTDRSYVKVYDAVSKEEVPSGVIPAGTYYYVAVISILNDGSSPASVTYGIQEVKCTSSNASEEAWKPTFDIWVKNIWGTTKGTDETDEEYAQRVWVPILGDALGNEAAVVFSTGMLAVSSDYQFVINSFAYDTSKTYGGVRSEWRLTLVKSDAELDATGYYIPNASTGGNAMAGDHFFFTGIDMPHSYVVWAEERLNEFKTNNGLGELSDINPTWVVNLDKVRINTPESSDYTTTLADQLAVGSRINLKSTQFIGSSALTLYIQSLQYTWQEPKKDQPYIVPDIEVVLSDKIITVKSAVEELSGQIDQIRQQYVSLAHLEETIESIVSAKFLGKVPTSNSSVVPAEGPAPEPEENRSPLRLMAAPMSAANGVNAPTVPAASANTVIEDGPTQVLPTVKEVSRVATEFRNLVSGEKFRAGAIGGRSWGFYKDKDGDAVLETDNLVVRKRLSVNELVVNQITYMGGKQIISAASIECNQVIDTDAGYECYFDQKQGTVKNLFAVGDVAYSQVFNVDNVEVRYYKRKVIGVAVDHILLSKTDAAGGSAPEKGDVIVQYGSYTDTTRQYIIIWDVIGGGYERMLSGLDSVTATGEEYYFAGYDPILGNRWFVGDDSTHMEFDAASKRLKIKGTIVQSPSGDEFPTPCNRGVFVPGTSLAFYGDLFTYNGSSWLCIDSAAVDVAHAVSAAPSESSSKWRLYAKKGDDGEDGNPGKEGKFMNGPREFVSGTKYFGIEDADSDFYDVVYQMIGEQPAYYQCKVTNTGQALPTEIGGSNAYWNGFNQFELVATKAMVVDDAFIDNLEVRKLKTKDAGEGHIEAEGSALTIFNESGEAAVQIHTKELDLTTSTPPTLRLNTNQTLQYDTPDARVAEIGLNSITITKVGNYIVMPSLSVSLSQQIIDAMPLQAYFSIEFGTSSNNLIKSVYSWQTSFGASHRFDPVTLTLPEGTLHLYIRIYFTNAKNISLTFGSANVSVHYPALSTQIASNGVLLQGGEEAIKTTKNGLSIVQDNTDYGIMGSGAIGTLSKIKRIVVCTSYPSTQETGVLYIKTT